MSLQTLNTRRKLSSPVRKSDVLIWEAFDPDDKALWEARRLYKEGLPPEERIPWRWIRHQIEGRVRAREGEWKSHLLLARLNRPKGLIDPVVGFTYGAHVPGFGGYMGYIAVSKAHRGHGIGGRLLRLLIQHLQVDAACAGVSLPFVLWESRRPEPGAPPREWDNWRARVALFEGVGARQVQGIEFRVPNFAAPGTPPIPMQLFLLPVDKPAADFDADALWEVAVGLRESVYAPTEDKQDAAAMTSCGPVLLPGVPPSLLPPTQRPPRAG
jgi:GNAT superfamily N-acetyltransferase